MKKLIYINLIFLTIISCSDDIDIDNNNLSMECNISNYEANIISVDSDDKELNTFLVKNGDERTFRFFEPSNINENTKILFLIHGWGGTAKQFWDFYPEFRVKAEENNYILVYPNGKPNNYDGLLYGQPKGTWQWWCQDVSAGECDTDDVSFLAELAQTMQSKYNICPKNTFASGISMGGVATFVANQKASKYFNGAASFIGSTFPAGGFPTADAFPLLMFDGTNDPFFITEGTGSIPSIIYNFWPEETVLSRNYSISFDTTRQTIFDYYAGNANCSSYEKIQITNSNSLVKWTNCDNGFEMWKYTVKDWGHTTPTLDSEAGINYADVVFEFFNKF
jgi:poly(3-hydroxybutyrate) depolymerase